MKRRRLKAQVARATRALRILDKRWLGSHSWGLPYREPALPRYETPVYGLYFRDDRSPGWNAYVASRGVKRREPCEGLATWTRNLSLGRQMAIRPLEGDDAAALVAEVYGGLAREASN